MIRKYLDLALAIALLTISCTSNLKLTETPITRASPFPIATNAPPSTKALQPTDSSTPSLPTFTPTRWNVYDPDPQHLWNRLYRQLYVRTTKDGKEYGRDSLDLLVWGDEIHLYLLENPSYQQAIQLLDEFLSTHAEKLITDPLKRALLQRDVWAVFDALETWLESHPDDYAVQRHELQSRLAQVIRRLALTKQEIQSLPDNYTTVVNSRAFPANYHEGNQDVAFLPANFFAPDGDWVCIGREGGPVAMIHLQNLPFLGRSAFFVLIRVPGGRVATLDFLHQLQRDKQPELPVGTEVALVRRILLIDQQGNIIPSPIVESVQLRHFYTSHDQVFYEFELNRYSLFAGKTGGLRPLERDETGFPLFLFHGVDFPESDAEEVDKRKVVILNTCRTCHEHVSYGINTILSYSRDVFPLSSNESPALLETTPALEAQATITWKLKQETWRALQALWRESTP